MRVESSDNQDSRSSSNVDDDSNNSGGGSRSSSSIGDEDQGRLIVILHVETVESDSNNDAQQASNVDAVLDADIQSQFQLAWSEMVERSIIYCDVCLDVDDHSTLTRSASTSSSSSSTPANNATSNMSSIANKTRLHNNTSTGSSSSSNNGHRLRRLLLNDVQQNVQITRQRAVYNGQFPRRWQVFHVSKRIRSMSLSSCFLQGGPWPNGTKDAYLSMPPLVSVPVSATHHQFEWNADTAALATAPMHLHAQIDIAGAKQAFLEAHLSVSNETDASENFDSAPASLEASYSGTESSTFDPIDKKGVNGSETIASDLIDDEESLDAHATPVSYPLTGSAHNPESVAFDPVANDSTDTSDTIPLSKQDETNGMQCPPPSSADPSSFEQLWLANFNNTVLAHRFRVDLDHSTLFRNNMELLMKQEMRDINIALCVLGVVAVGSIVVLLVMAYFSLRDKKHHRSDSLSSSMKGRPMGLRKPMEGITVRKSSDKKHRYLPMSPDGSISPLSLDRASPDRAGDDPAAAIAKVSSDTLSPCSKLQADWWKNREIRRQNRNQRVVVAAVQPQQLPTATSGTVVTPDDTRIAPSGDDNSVAHAGVLQRLFLTPISPIVSPHQSFSDDDCDKPETPPHLAALTLERTLVDSTNLPISALLDIETPHATEKTVGGETTSGVAQQPKLPRRKADAGMRPHSDNNHPHAFLEDYW